MSGPTQEKARHGVPDRWMYCPKIGKLIDGLFLPFKTPLCALYDRNISEESLRFYPKHVFEHRSLEGRKLGLWIDLTNTDRYYFIDEVKNQGCIYRKMRLRGHGKSPEEKETDSFVQLVQDFTKDHPGEVVGVHCTHGFNRTGFLIAAYLIIAKNWAVDHAILTFAKQRPCGIYKQEYLFDLFKRYGNTDHCLEAPSEPSWEYGDAFRDDGSTDPSTNEAYEDAEAVNGTDKTQGKRKEEELSHIEQPAKRPQLQNLPSD